MGGRSVKILLSIAAALVVFVLVKFNEGTPQMAWVLATTALMAALWIGEPIPMGATSLLPIAIFPLAGIADAKTITPLYANHIIFLFIEGFLLAFAMERWHLHQRIAYKIIDFIGFKPQRIILGFITAAFVLSMWINNTATTIVLLAPALAIIAELKQKDHESAFGVALLLGICYASSIGGTVTPIGTAPNLLLKTYYEEAFPDRPALSFFNWIKFALPIAAVFCFIMYLMLIKLIKKQPASAVATDFKQKIKSLGKPSYEERVILVLFTALALLWITANSLEIGSFHFSGWTQLFAQPDYIRDSVIGMAVVLLLFFIPSKNEKGSNLLEWSDAKKLPFDILFIFGGGFCLAKGFEISGLDTVLMHQMKPLESLPLWLVILSVSLFMTFLTEITSNTATAQLVLPLLILVAKATGVEPLYLLIPATFSASFAFMLPVATPPNAIVFATGQVPSKQMMKTGLRLNLLGAVLLSVYTYIFAPYF